MNTRTLGADLTVSALGLGCMGFSHAYGAPTERSEAVRAIRAVRVRKVADTFGCRGSQAPSRAGRPDPYTRRHRNLFFEGDAADVPHHRDAACRPF